MTPHEKQVMMFSATLSKEIRPVCKKFMMDVRANNLPCFIFPHSYDRRSVNGLHLLELISHIVHGPSQKFALDTLSTLLQLLAPKNLISDL